MRGEAAVKASARIKWLSIPAPVRLGLTVLGLAAMLGAVDLAVRYPSLPWYQEYPHDAATLVLSVVLWRRYGR